MKPYKPLPKKHSCGNKILPITVGMLLILNPVVLSAQQNLPDQNYVYNEVLQSITLARNASTELQMRDISKRIISISASNNDRSATNNLLFPPNSAQNLKTPNGLFELPTELRNIRDSNNIRFAYCFFKNDMPDAVAFVIIGSGSNGKFDKIQSCTELNNYISSKPILDQFLYNNNITDDLFLTVTSKELTHLSGETPEFGPAVESLNILKDLSSSSVKIGQVRLVKENNQFFIYQKHLDETFSWKPVSGKWSENSPPSKDSDLIDLNLNSGSLGLGLDTEKQKSLPENKLAILNIGNKLDITKYAAGIAFQNQSNTNFVYMGMALDPDNQKFEIKNIANKDQPNNILSFDAVGNITIGHDSSKTTTFNNKSTFNENVTFKNTVDLTSTLTVNGTSTFKSNVTIGELSKAANLEVYGESTFNNTVNIKGTTTLNNLTVNETSTFNKLASFNENVKIAKSLTVTDSSTFNSNLDVKNRLNSWELYVSGITNLDNKLTIAKNGIEVNGSSILNNGLTVKNEIANLQTNLNVTGNTLLNNNLEVMGTSTLNQANITNQLSGGSLDVKGTGIFRDKITIEKGGVSVTGDSIFNSMFRANGPVNLSSELTVTGLKTQLGSGLTVSGDTTLEQNLNVNGITNLNYANIENNLNTGSITVRGTSIFQDGITIEKNGINVTGLANFYNGINVNGSVNIIGNVNAKSFSGNGSNITNLQASNLVGVVSITNGGTGKSTPPGQNQILIGNPFNSYDLKTIASSNEISLIPSNSTISFELKETGVAPGTYGSPLAIPRITVDSKGRITYAENAAPAILPLNLNVKGLLGGIIHDLDRVQFISNKDMELNLNFSAFPYLNTLNQDIGIGSNPRFNQLTASSFNGYLNGVAERANQLNKCISVNLTYILPNGAPYPTSRTGCLNENLSFDFQAPFPLQINVTAENGGNASSISSGTDGRNVFYTAYFSYNLNNYPTNITNPTIPNSLITLRSPLFNSDASILINGTNRDVYISPSSTYHRAALLDQGLRTTDNVTFNAVTIANSDNLFLSPDGTVKSRTLNILEQATIKNRLVMQHPSTTEGTLSISGSEAKIIIGNTIPRQGLLNPQITLDGPTGSVLTQKMIATEEIFTPKTIRAGIGDNTIFMDGNIGLIQAKNLNARESINSQNLVVNNQINVGPTGSPKITLNGNTGTITTENIVINGALSINELNLGSGSNLIRLTGSNGKIDAREMTIRETLTAKNIKLSENIEIYNGSEKKIAFRNDGNISSISLNISERITTGTGSNAITLDGNTGKITANALTTTGNIVAGSGAAAITLNASTGQITATNLNISENIMVGSGTNTITLSALNGSINSNSVQALNKIVVGNQTDNEITLENGVVTAKQFLTTSDARLKTNILAIHGQDILDRMQNIHLYGYNFIADPFKERTLGVLAQEIFPLFPEAVRIHTEGSLKNYLSVNYNTLGAAAAVGVGEISKKIDSWQLRLKDTNTLTTNLPNFIVNNLTTDTIETQKLKAKHIESETGKFDEIDTKKLSSLNGKTKQLQAETMNSGQTQGFSGFGGSLMLFTANQDGHYLVNVTASDGSYATATVFVASGQVHIAPMAAFNISIESLGNSVHAIAAGKNLKASWIRMG